MRHQVRNHGVSTITHVAGDFLDMSPRFFLDSGSSLSASETVALATPAAFATCCMVNGAGILNGLIN